MILSGVVAASGGAFVATGGTIIDAGGYRHHVFNSSGTFTVESGQKTVYVFTQNGGQNGRGYNIPYASSIAYAGEGGAAGAGNYSSTGFIAQPGSRSVTVGGAGSPTTVSGWTALDITTGVKGGGGAAYIGFYENYGYDDYWGYYIYYTFYGLNATTGQNSNSNNIVALNPTLYNGLSAFRTMTTGGGGGGGGLRNYTDNWIFYLAGGGVNGGGNGASEVGAATNGQANTGGGGGGAWLGLTRSGSQWNVASVQGAGTGGSGFAIISYSLA